MKCATCGLGEEVSGIFFDSFDVCNYCHQIEKLRKTYGTGNRKGQELWKGIVEKAKKVGSDSRFDCVVGVSGGTDSSYLLWLAVKEGLRPLAVHYDNTWNTAAASSNIRSVTESLGVPLVTIVADNRQIDSIKTALLRSGVREWDMDTDLALVQVMRSVAAKYRIRYILEGHSFTAEGVSPVGDNYIDGRYLLDVHKRHGWGNLRKFPNLTLSQFLKWAVFYRQKFIRPLWYLDYDKLSAKKILSDETGWTDYGGHHLENRASAFLHMVYLPRKFSIDFRYLPISARVRAGEISTSEGIKLMMEPIGDVRELEEYVRVRLNMDEKEYQSAMGSQPRSSEEFRNYKRHFRILRPLFFVLLKLSRIPESFYFKYCKPIPVGRGKE